jgi:hypothetical protein
MRSRLLGARRLNDPSSPAAANKGNQSMRKKNTQLPSVPAVAVQRVVRRCDDYRCKKEATWQDGWRGRVIPGKFWCTDHAMQFRNPHELVAYYGEPVENTDQETQPPNSVLCETVAKTSNEKDLD